MVLDCACMFVAFLNNPDASLLLLDEGNLLLDRAEDFSLDQISFPEYDTIESDYLGLYNEGLSFFKAQLFYNKWAIVRATVNKDYFRL